MDAEVFAILNPHLVFINNTPELLWGLMDINLMPEQITTVKQANMLIKVVEAYKRGDIING